MGGGNSDGIFDTNTPSQGVVTIVLVGKTGNGKSATGNSILNREAFKSESSPSSVTSTCELQQAVMEDGRTVNVIDTPGLFDSEEFDNACQEIVKCIDYAKDGIHAIVVVLSAQSRFSKEEEDTLKMLQVLFGEKINDYVIVVFTHEDALKKNGQDLAQYLLKCPKRLQAFISLFQNRVVSFDNKLSDPTEKVKQVRKLFSLVDAVVAQNNGKLYSNEFFSELKARNLDLYAMRKEVESSKACISEGMVQLKQEYDAHLKQMTEMVENKLKDNTTMLEQLLVEEKAARLEAEKESEKMRSTITDMIQMQKGRDAELSQANGEIRRAQAEIAHLRERLGCLIQ